MTLTKTELVMPYLTEDEAALVDGLIKQLSSYQAANMLVEGYYEGTHRVRQLGLSIPPQFSKLESVVGWPTQAVDFLDARLEWHGWTAYGQNDYGLSEVYENNGLHIDSGSAHLDALIFGTSFVVVGAGYDGEPDPLVTIESAKNMTGSWNARTRRLDAALGVNRRENGQVTEVTLYLPNSNIWLERRRGLWLVVDRDDHNLGRVLVAQMINKPRASRVGGKSEITRAIRHYTDQGVRTLMGMELNREFYSMPQRYIMGVEPDMFLDESGNPIPGWQTIMGSVLALPPNDEGGNPDVGQFAAASPAPYLEQMRGLTQLVAAEASLPASYLGWVTDNPSSADAIRQAEAQLIKRAEKRQLTFGRAWTEVGRLALLVRDGEIPSDFNTVNAKWADAATPTRAAAADEMVKLIGAGVMPADSTVVYDRLNLDPQEQKQLEADKRRTRADERILAIREALSAPVEGDANGDSLSAA